MFVYELIFVKVLTIKDGPLEQENLNEKNLFFSLFEMSTWMRQNQTNHAIFC